MNAFLYPSSTLLPTMHGIKLYSFNCYLLCFCFCPQMWRSGTLRPDIIGELHMQVTQNLHVATELFHEVDIDGEGIFQRMPRRAIVDSGSPW